MRTAEDAYFIGRGVDYVAALEAWMQSRRAGDQAEITVYRAGEELVITVTFSAPNETAEPVMDAA